MIRTLYLTVVFAILASLTAASSVSAATYFVRPTGNDSRDGTTVRKAWRTVGRVNDARLVPGDRVLFEGGGTFTDSPLMPRTSGSTARPIRFSSFGKKMARIVNGDGAVWFSGKHDLTFDRLWLSSGGSNSSVVAGSSTGSKRIRVSRSVILGSRGVGVISPSQRDSRWRLTCNTIESVGDSGIIVVGSQFLVSGNVIRNTGWNAGIPYGKHGIYAKGEGITIRSNVIERFADIGISLRAPNSRALKNTIVGGRFAIAFHDESPSVGHSWIQGNVGYGITEVGFYFAPDQPTAGGSAAEQFTVSGNTFSLADLGVGFDIRSAPRNLMNVTGNTAATRNPSTTELERIFDERRRGCQTSGH